MKLTDRITADSVIKICKNIFAGFQLARKDMSDSCTNFVSGKVQLSCRCIQFSLVKDFLAQLHCFSTDNANSKQNANTI